MPVAVKTQTAQKVRTIGCPKILQYVANGSDSWQIPGGNLLREMHLRLQYTLTTSANLAAAAISPGAEWGAVALIQILAGTEVIKEYTGEELRIMAAIQYGQWPRPRLVLGATSTAVDSTLILPFWDWLARKPIDCALNTSSYGNLRIVVRWNDYSKVASTATAFSVNPTIDWTMETSTGYTGRLLETRTQRLVFNPTATGDFTMNVITGLVAIRSLLIYAKTSGNVDDPGKISNLKLKSLSTNLIESTFPSLRDSAWQRLKLREYVASGAKASPMQDAGFDMDNYCFLDMAKDGYLTEAFPTFRINDLRLIATLTSAPNQIIVLANYIIPPTN